MKYLNQHLYFYVQSMFQNKSLISKFQLLAFTHIAFVCFGIAQIKLEFNWRYGSKNILLSEEGYKLNTNDSMVFETLKCYISNIQLLKNNKSVYTETKSFHLLDASLSSTLKINLNVDSTLAFDAVKFNLGIDSLTNVSGAMAGDLDPTKGMYWAWQSGYINCKLEGKNNTCQNKDHSFQFHLGGYISPNNCLKTIQLNTPKTKHVKINIELQDFFESITLQKEHHIMSPNKTAVSMSAIFSNCFKIN